MIITVELPDDIASRPDPARYALEAVVISGLRSGVLASYDGRSLLGLTRDEFDGFLKYHDIVDEVSGADEGEQVVSAEEQTATEE
jgi:hypothetical protein